MNLLVRLVRLLAWPYVWLLVMFLRVLLRFPGLTRFFVVRALFPKEHLQNAIESVIEEREDRGEDIAADLVERALRDPDQRQRVMKSVPQILLASRPSMFHVGDELVESQGASRNLREAYTRVFTMHPELLRAVLRQGLGGAEADAWRRIGWRFGVSLEEQERLICAGGVEQLQTDEERP